MTNKNNSLCVLFNIFIIICSILGTTAFILRFTKKNCPEG